MTLGGAAIIGRMSERIDYVELPGGDLAATKSFYASAFGWGFTDCGPTYAGFENPGWMADSPPPP